VLKQALRYARPPPRLFDGVPPLHLEILAVRGVSLATHVSYRVIR
jgi:hypothetical protein